MKKKLRFLACGAEQYVLQHYVYISLFTPFRFILILPPLAEGKIYN